MKAIQWFPGHMAKGKRLIEEHRKIIDLFIIVIDSRIPYSGIHDSFARGLIDPKKIMLIMSKSDLADDNQTKKWIEHYKKEFGIVVALNISDNTRTKKALNSKIDAYFKENNILRKQVMILGVPNVGKSTLINSLSDKKVARVENRPGLTRGVSFVNGSNGIRFFDTPGILEPKVSTDRDAYSLALTNAIKKDILDKADVVEYGVNFIKKYYFNQFVKYYGIADRVDKDSELFQIEEAICEVKGFILKGKEYDYERLFNNILISIANGRVGKMTFDRYDEIGR